MDNGKRERLILVIDDHQDQLQIIKQVLTNGTVPCQIVSLPSSSQAMDFLCHKGKYSQAPRPDLILLDTNLSDGDGQAILSAVKTDTSLRRIPTILLSSTADPKGIINSYQLQCNSYVIKPENLINLSDVIQVIESFWLNIVTLPLE